ncbi:MULTISPECIES: hypothetical protein [Pseudomonas]|uniref:hypothetical protein n=1 Tax=Pseudomonas TaxID=286 RepID=UPI00069B981F|nr:MULTISPECIES: hypothetical protein [Pseudomonas]MDH1933119.1 hypothetical protein [Pseudomonas sp. GD03696]PHN28421.1 hypothetical protein AO259_24230 [Pseudomonas sp. ICMP 564]QHA83917.1 hypothetical protein E3Z27_20750 [Pseudomonas mediterranea]UWH24052.1 hypothetical protein KW568_06415 [Pseudomonas sp. HD6515]
MNTWVSFQSAEKPLLGQFSLSGNSEGEAVRLARGSAAAIGEIEEFCEAHGIYAHFRRAGWSSTATSDALRGA